MARSSRWKSCVSLAIHAVALCRTNSFRITELSMGIICGCMPYLTSLFMSKHLKISRFPLLKRITSHISSTFSKRFGRSKKSSTFTRIDEIPGNEFRLETRILGSVKGQGRFLDSRSRTPNELLDRTIIEHYSREDVPIPDSWSV